MQHNSATLNRRKFLQNSAVVIAGASSLSAMPLIGHAVPFTDDNINLIGPKEGYSTQLGILVSMMAWNRASVINAVSGLSQQDLDFLADDKSNTIGALLLHLAATDAIYQDLTFNNLKDFSEENKKKWGTAMELGDEGRKEIKGNNLDYYLNALQEVRQKTLSEFKKRDDKWLAQVDPQFFDNKPTNNFCKWFHVCEHESNHRGQIAVIRKRLPGTK